MGDQGWGLRGVEAWGQCKVLSLGARNSPEGERKMLKAFAIALEKIIRQLVLLHLTKHQAQMNCIPES